MKFARVFLVVSLLARFAFAGSDFVNSNSQMTEIQKSYLNRDFKKMSVAIKNELLASPNAFSKEEMIDLYSKAQRIAGLDGVAADWTLPEEIRKMKIRVRRQQSEGVTFALSISGEVSELGLIDQIKVWQHGGRTYADKLQGIGEWEEEKRKIEPFKNEYRIKSKKFSKEIPSGLYLINITLKNGKKTDGWFILTPDLNASRSPQVIYPQYGQAIKTRKPTFSFENYFSPEYKPHEIRSMWLGVANENWTSDVWEFWERSPYRTELSIEDSHAEGQKELTSGNYNFVHVMMEESKFGDVWIGRSATVIRPFSILD